MPSNAWTFRVINVLYKHNWRFQNNLNWLACRCGPETPVALAICGLKGSQTLLSWLGKQPASRAKVRRMGVWSDLECAWHGNIWPTDGSVYKRKLVLNIDQLQEIIPIDIRAYRQPSIGGGAVGSYLPHPPLRMCQVSPKPFSFGPLALLTAELLFFVSATAKNNICAAFASEW